MILFSHCGGSKPPPYAQLEIACLNYHPIHPIFSYSISENHRKWKWNLKIYEISVLFFGGVENPLTNGG